MTAACGVATTVERDNKAAKMMLRIIIWRGLEDVSSGLLMGDRGRTEDMVISLDFLKVKGIKGHSDIKARPTEPVTAVEWMARSCLLHTTAYSFVLYME